MYPLARSILPSLIFLESIEPCGPWSKETKLIDYFYSDEEIIEVRVYFGSEFMKGEYLTVDLSVKHPLFDGDRDFDVKLIRMRDPVQFVNNGKYYENNIICLPPKISFISNKYEYVFSTGWGFGHNNHMQTGARA